VEMFKSVKGVDPPEQPVSSRVRYGMTCLLIRDALKSVSCLVLQEGYQDYLRAARCKRGCSTMNCPGNLSNARVLRLPKQSRTYDS
jgi:hypothetical protein